MHIQSHNLQLGSERSYNRSESEQESLRVGRVSVDPETGNRRVDVVFEASSVNERELNTYSAMALRSQAANTPPTATTSVADPASAPSATETTDAPLSSLNAKDRLKLELIAHLHKAITGKEIKLTLVDPEALQAKTSPKAPPAALASAQPDSPEPPTTVGLEYQRSRRIAESEQTRFAASGQVITADGQQIDIELELRMARSVTIEQHQRLQLGARLSDPLVLNFGGTAAELGNTRFRFDLNLDGTEDNVPALAGQSAFLVLDSNRDGKINDGSEMFGARSGNGFAELAEYDTDGNGFIDEGDAIFSRLRLWSPTENGAGGLMSLSSHGVGAIYLGSAQTEFSLTPDLQENRLGVIRTSSIYLSEDGQAGSVQQLDLSI